MLAIRSFDHNRYVYTSTRIDDDDDDDDDDDGDELLQFTVW